MTRNQAVLDAAMKFAQARLSPPSFAQIVGEAAVDLPADYFNEVHAEYTLRRDVLVKRLNAIPGVKCLYPGRGVLRHSAVAGGQCSKILPMAAGKFFAQWGYCNDGTCCGLLCHTGQRQE